MDKLDEVSVTVVETASTIIYELRVGDGDVGKIIGRHGRTATVLRTNLSAVSAKEGGKRAMMEIIEEDRWPRG